MTYRDLLIWEHPEELNEKSLGGCNRCPKDYGYENSMCCVDINTDPSHKICTECWDREITDTKLLEEKGLVSEEKARIPYIELLKLEHPEHIRHTRKGDEGLACPHSYGYTESSECPSGYTCSSCWERNIEDPKIRALYYHLASKKALEEGMKAVGEESKKAGMSIQEAVYRVSGIKDSGDRTEFETGAVRDMHEGKGRCDLMPLDVIAQYYSIAVDWTSCVVNDNSDDVRKTLNAIHEFINSGSDIYLMEALVHFKAFKDVETMFLEDAIHFEEGAKKYGDNNWRKGIPVRCYIDSAVRHYLKYLRGDKDERHDRAFCWNILCCIWTCKHHPELNDYAKKEPSADA